MNYIGYYNEREYYVYRVRSIGGLVEVYHAGNSPFDSQAFVEPDDGVGLKEMKRMCIQTGKEIAKEEGKGKFLGAEYREEI